MPNPTAIFIYLEAPGSDRVVKRIEVYLDERKHGTHIPFRASEAQRAFCIGLLLARFRHHFLDGSNWQQIASTDENGWAKSAVEGIRKQGEEPWWAKSSWVDESWWPAVLSDDYEVDTDPLNLRRHPLRLRVIKGKFTVQFKNFTTTALWAPERMYFFKSDGNPVTDAWDLLQIASDLERHLVAKWTPLVPTRKSFEAEVKADRSGRDITKSKLQVAPKVVALAEPIRALTQPSEPPANNDLLNRYLLQIARRNEVIEGLGHPAITFSMDEIPIDLPLKLTYSYPRRGEPQRIQGASMQDIVEREGQKLWQDRVKETRAENESSERGEQIWSMGARLSAGPRMIVVGDPGCGKSTLLSSLAWFYALRSMSEVDREKEFPGAIARASSRELPDQPWVPILVSFKSRSEVDEDDCLRALVEKSVSRLVDATEVAALRDLLLARLRAGTALLLVDGIDELVDALPRKALSKSLADDARGWPDMRIVASSRWIGFRAVGETLQHSFDSLNVKPLGDALRRAYVKRLIGKLGCSPEIIKSKTLFIERQVCGGGTLAPMCDSVMLLTQVVNLLATDPDKKVPDCKAKVLSRTITHLIEKPWNRGGIHLVESDVRRKLEWLAAEMNRDETSRWQWPEPAVVECLQKKFWPPRTKEERNYIAEPEAQIWLSAVMERTGLLHVGGIGPADERGNAPCIIQFFHPLLQEYFLGMQLRSERSK